MIISLASLVMSLENYICIKEFPIAITDQEDYIDWMNYANTIRDYNLLTGITIILIMIRLVRFIYTTFPNFGIVFQKLNAAHFEILVFVSLLLLALFGIMMMGHVSFGLYSKSYRLIEDSVITIYLIFIGFYDFFDFYNDNYFNPLAPYFLIFFMIFFKLILINVFFVILRNNYADVKEKKQKFNEAYALLISDNTKIFKDKLIIFVTCQKPLTEKSSKTTQEAHQVKNDNNYC